ncbi:MAG: hypothetical protein GXX85_05560 [Ignavibacteria bacterium]|nr:hypothetical protein [Ignavibacteria bacterium]
MDSNTVEEVKKISIPKINGEEYIINYFIIPFRAGLYGFLIFFGILFVTKLMGHVIGTQKTFIISASDFLLSFIGFVPIFMIRFLKNFRKNDN